VGDDFPQEYLDLLVERNIDISGLEVVKGGKTFFWSGRYRNDLNSRYFRYPIKCFVSSQGSRKTIKC
jgi:hypothetical protein